MKRFDIITIFPEIITVYASESILARAATKKILSIAGHDLRNWTKDKHRSVDDAPYGGGPGMVLKVEPIAEAVTSIKKMGGKKKRIIVLSPQGKQFTNADAARLSKEDQLIFICGRYEGIDERVMEHLADESLSVGPYVVTGGELPALLIVDAVARQIPGVLGKQESLEEINGSFPQYTTPREVRIKKGRKTVIASVPDVLLSGNHKKIAAWRREQEGKKSF
jgi:tRNA (guanine37-N1)-methyltransferase